MQREYWIVKLTQDGAAASPTTIAEVIATTKLPLPEVIATLQDMKLQPGHDYAILAVARRCSVKQVQKTILEGL